MLDLNNNNTKARGKKKFFAKRHFGKGLPNWDFDVGINSIAPQLVGFDIWFEIFHSRKREFGTFVALTKDETK